MAKRRSPRDQSVTDRYAPDVLSCWVYFEALRRLGFAATDIYVTVYYDPSLGFVVCGVALRTQGLEFNISAARLTRNEEQFFGAWTAFGNDVVAGRLTDEIMQPVWDARAADVGGLPIALMDKGFTLPLAKL